MMKKQIQSAKSKLKKNLLKTSKSPKLNPRPIYETPFNTGTKYTYI
jgi:hypothetical protein